MNWHGYFTYDPGTGSLIWRERPREHFASEWAWKVWNKQYPGAVVGSRRTRRGGQRHGVMLSVNGRHQWAHRIIWEMIKGPIPAGKVVDHKNRDPWDNRLRNLRTASRSQNGSNTRLNKNNKSGHRGVRHRPEKKKPWEARITINKHVIVLGLFESMEEAVLARRRAAKKHHGRFAVNDAPSS